MKHMMEDESSRARWKGIDDMNGRVSQGVKQENKGFLARLFGSSRVGYC